MKNRVIVTGGAGFLGSHLCERLLKEGNEVICVDNFFTGQKRNIVHLLDNPYFEVVRHDICFSLYLEADEIYNLACPASPVHYQRHPTQTTKVNVNGSTNMLGLAKLIGAKILQASTSEVYGDPTVHPQTEDYWGNVNPIGPRGVYDEAKRFAEAMTTAYNRYHGLRTRIVRIFNTYGPRMRINDGRAVPNFIAQALRGEDVTVYGTGEQTRSFCYISDLVDGIIRLMHSNTSEPVNIGNPAELSIEQIAQKIIKATHSTSRVIYKPLPTDDPKVRKPDITRACDILDWNPKVSLDQGLSTTIDYFREKIR